jgi:hypothetical protein
LPGYIVTISITGGDGSGNASMFKFFTKNNDTAVIIKPKIKNIKALSATKFTQFFKYVPPA